MTPTHPALDNASTAEEVAHAVKGLEKSSAVSPYTGEDSSFGLAFQDDKFLVRRETRGIRLQLEMLKPDLIMAEDEIQHTLVAFGSARYPSPEKAQEMLKAASTPADIRRAEQAVRNSRYYQLAYDFGNLVAKRNLSLPQPDRLTICTGGGPGIMEAANRGAFEAGDVTIGLNIALPFEQQPNPYITPRYCFHFHYFAMRKMHFMMRARALVAFPGGFGTMDELFEVLTLCQTQKSKLVPIVLVGSEFWKRAIDFQYFVDEGVISEKDLDMFTIVDTAQDAWDYIKKAHKLVV